MILWWKRRCVICFYSRVSGTRRLLSSRHTIWSVSTSCKCLVSLFLRLSVSSQKSAGEVTLKDCLRLFTKEDVLDGEERPVRSVCFPFIKTFRWLPVQRLTAVSLPPADVQQMQSQKEMHQKVQHSEVPSDPRASYPFPPVFAALVCFEMFACFLLTYKQKPHVSETRGWVLLGEQISCSPVKAWVMFNEC